MFAVIKTGGKQYRVAPGDRFTVEKLAAEPGETIRFEDVLMIGGESMALGTPTVDGAAVQAEVVEQMRGPKTLNFKRRRRKASSKRLKGHRQYLTLVEITEILASGGGEGKPAVGARAARRAGASEATTAGVASAGARGDTGTPSAAGGSETGEVSTARPANLLTEAKGEADDLTKLPGVGPKLQEKLNANGVYHFWQIAEWTPEEATHMDEQLSLKGRVAREDWIGQAKTFAAEEK